MLKFIVMSDLHLMPPGRKASGVDTEERLRLAVESINEQHAHFDFCILAGDLTDGGDIAAYHLLQDILAGLKIPCHITLGNHDHRPRFQEVYGNRHDDENGFVQTVIDAEGYRVIVLDSSEPGMGHGVLCDRRLGWLDARLAEAVDRPVIVVVHHHTNDLHTDIDGIKIKEAPRFVETLKRHPDVRQVIAGHVHFASAGTYHGLAFTTVAGNTYSVTIELEGMPGPKRRLDGPAQYALVLADEIGTAVHFHNFFDRHLMPLDAATS